MAFFIEKMDQNSLLTAIDAQLDSIRSRRPLNQGELCELQKSLQVSFTYHSNAIEGNTLTLGETKLLIEDGITVGGKTVREINEALNHTEMFMLLAETIRDGTKISEELIKKLHGLVLKNIDDENAGSYRKVQAYISGEEKLPPDPADISGLMKELIHWSLNAREELHSAVYAAEFHYRFVKIHPFIDGNGRTARILINAILMQCGYPMVIIPVIRRGEYIGSLHSSGSKSKFIIFLSDVILQNLKDYERMINPET